MHTHIDRKYFKRLFFLNLFIDCILSKAEKNLWVMFARAWYICIRRADKATISSWKVGKFKSVANVEVFVGELSACDGVCGSNLTAFQLDCACPSVSRSNSLASSLCT